MNAQLCIYVDGNVVVDLYGTAVGDAEYGPDTLSVRFTSVRLTRPLLALYSKVIPRAIKGLMKIRLIAEYV